MKTKLKIAATIIVFNGDEVLEECLTQIYPFMSQILISEGCVSYFAEKGFASSTDRTNEIIHSFPDPENKIKIKHGTYHEKREQSNALMDQLDPLTDYVWQIDADEVYSKENIEKIIKVLEEEKPFSMGVRSFTFFGGFDRIIGGFEMQNDNFLRIFKASPQCCYGNHRPPGLIHPVARPQGDHISSDDLYEKTGAFFHHYSYVFAEKVKQKIEYYKARVSRDNCIDDYFERVWKRWVLAQTEDERDAVEFLFSGVQEFKCRPAAFTIPFDGKHPEAIEKNLDKLWQKWSDQLYKVK